MAVYLALSHSCRNSTSKTDNSGVSHEQSVLQKGLPESSEVGVHVLLVLKIASCGSLDVFTRINWLSLWLECLQALNDEGEGAGKSISEEELNSRKAAALRAYVVGLSTCSPNANVHCMVIAETKCKMSRFQMDAACVLSSEIPVMCACWPSVLYYPLAGKPGGA